MVKEEMDPLGGDWRKPAEEKPGAARGDLRAEVS